MPVTGQDVVIANLRNFGGGFLKHVDSVMEKSLVILDKEVSQNMSLTDHSLRDLALLGHPYRIGGSGLHEPKWQVHKQTGTLLASKRLGTVKAVAVGTSVLATAWVGLDENAAAHAPFVVWGTSRMIPRDFLHGSLDVRKDAIFEMIRTNLRDAVISYKGKETH